MGNYWETKKADPEELAGRAVLPPAVMSRCSGGLEVEVSSGV